MSEHYKDVEAVIHKMRGELRVEDQRRNRLFELLADHENRKNLSPHKQMEVGRKIRLGGGAPMIRSDLARAVGAAWAWQRSIEMLEAIEAQVYHSGNDLIPQERA